MNDAPSRATSPAACFKPTLDAVYLDTIIRAAATANYASDRDVGPAVADLVRSGVETLLEAAVIVSKRLCANLDMAEPNPGDRPPLAASPATQISQSE